MVGKQANTTQVTVKVTVKVTVIGDTAMSQIEKIRSNAEVHGVMWAAQYARKTGVNMDIVFLALFGHYSGAIVK